MPIKDQIKMPKDSLSIKIKKSDKKTEKNNEKIQKPSR